MPHCGIHREGFTIRKGKAHYAPDTRLEPKHISIHLDASKLVSERKLSARVIQTITCNQPERYIQFNGVNFSDVKVKDLTNDENVLTYRYDGKIIHVVWEKDLKQGESRSIEITYTVTDPVAGIIFSHRNRDELNHQYAVTDHETEKCRYWLACVDYPTIRTTVEFHITAIKEHLVFANGIHIKSIENETTHTEIWKLDYPCPSYLLCFAVGEFEFIQDEPLKDIPIAYIAPKGTKHEDVKLSFDKTRNIIEWLEKRIGVKFPFPKYYQIIIPGMNYGAMENISLVTFGFWYLMDEKFAKEYKYITDITVLHECAHSYFGDALVIKFFEHVWLKESWATYLEVCWLNDVYGEDEGSLELYNNLISYVEETESYVRPVVTRIYDSSWNLYDRHTYPGGGWRIHMLRKLLGEEHFWKAVTNFVETNQKGLVETEDFKRALEKQSSINLTKFFDQWIYGKGFPKLKGEAKYDPKKNTLVIDLKQIQKDEKKGIGLFDFDIDVEVTFTPRNTEPIIIRKTITFNDNERASVLFDNTPCSPFMIRIDPDNKILFTIDFNPGQDVLENTLRKANDIFNRIRSGKELIKIGTKQAIDSVIEAIKNEKFHGVRSVLYKELGKKKTIYTAQALAILLGFETHPRAQRFITQACIGFRDEKITQALFDYLEKKDIPYLSHNYSLQALASQTFDEKRAEDVLNLILKHIDNDKRYSLAIVKRGGYLALGNLASINKKAYQILKERIQIGKERNDCRDAITTAIACAASKLDEDKRNEASRILIDLLRDEDKQVQKAAIAGLVLIKATNAIGNIIAVKNLFPEQDHPWIERQIKKLLKSKKAPSDEVKKLQKELHDLRDMISKLQRRFDDEILKK